jgi:predicted transposase YbfD/YdcC
MVSAWACENQLSLAQVKTEDKSNEITAIPELLKLLDLKGCIVTIDAMGCQKEIAKEIVDGGADYVLALKGNQGNLHKDAELFFEDARKKNFKDITHDFHETVDGGHGRVEIRRYWTVSDIEWLEEREKWKKLNLIGMVESERRIGDEISLETRFYIATLPNNAKLFGESVRGHWGIENKVHWSLDIAFREDESRMRKGHSAENFALIRRLALNLLKNDKTLKVGIKAKRKQAGWDHNYLLTLLNA